MELNSSFIRSAESINYFCCFTATVATFGIYGSILSGADESAMMNFYDIFMSMMHGNEFVFHFPNEVRDF